MAFYFLIKLLQWGNLNISNAGVANDGFCGCITYRGRFNCALNTNRKEYAFYYFSFPAAHALWPRQRFIVSGSCQISGGKSLMVLHLFATRHLLLFGTWEGGGGREEESSKASWTINYSRLLRLSGKGVCEIVFHLALYDCISFFSVFIFPIHIWRPRLSIITRLLLLLLLLFNGQSICMYGRVQRFSKVCAQVAKCIEFSKFLENLKPWNVSRLTLRHMFSRRPVGDIPPHRRHHQPPPLPCHPLEGSLSSFFSLFYFIIL